MGLSLASSITSSGRVVPGCRVKLVNQDADGIGEICLWGRTIFMGYLNMEDKTCEAIDSEGWLRTGDMGRLDADGFLYITGRLKGEHPYPGHMRIGGTRCAEVRPASNVGTAARAATECYTSLSVSGWASAVTNKQGCSEKLDNWFRVT